MLRTGLVGLIAIAVVAALLSAAPLKTDTPESAKVEETDFTGKVVMIAAKEPIKGAYMQGVHVRRIGGRAFLVGRSLARPDTDGAKLPEITYWFPVDGVLILHVYNSVEDARKVREAMDQAEKK